MNLGEFKAALDTEATKMLELLRNQNDGLRYQLGKMNRENDHLRADNERQRDEIRKYKGRNDLAMRILNGTTEAVSGYVDDYVTCLQNTN